MHNRPESESEIKLLGPISLTLMLVVVGVLFNPVIRRVVPDSGQTNWTFDVFIVLVALYTNVVVFRVLQFWTRTPTPVQGPLSPLVVLILLSPITTFILGILLPPLFPDVSVEAGMVCGFCCQFTAITCMVLRCRAMGLTVDIFAPILFEAGLTAAGATMVWLHRSTLNLAAVLPAAFLLVQRVRWMKVHLRKVG